jgi:hypothetical protein
MLLRCHLLKNLGRMPTERPATIESAMLNEKKRSKNTGRGLLMQAVE